MDILKLQSLLEKQFNENYYTPKELEYGNAAGVFLSPFEYKEFLEYKNSIASPDNPEHRPYIERSQALLKMLAEGKQKAKGQTHGTPGQGAPDKHQGGDAHV